MTVICFQGLRQGVQSNHVSKEVASASRIASKYSAPDRPLHTVMPEYEGEDPSMHSIFSESKSQPNIVTRAPYDEVQAMHGKLDNVSTHMQDLDRTVQALR